MVTEYLSNDIKNKYTISKESHVSWEINKKDVP